jgi:hypothetical protein
MENEKKGMRFWLPCLEYQPDIPERPINQPFPPKKGEPAHREGARYLVTRLEMPRIKWPLNGEGEGHLIIYGEVFIDDPGTCKKLMLGQPPRLRFDPQEAVDLGYLSAAEVRAMPAGYEVKDREDVEPAGNVKMPEAPLPDFSRGFTKEGIINWALEHKIALDPHGKREELIKDLLTEIKKRKTAGTWEK